MLIDQVDLIVLLSIGFNINIGEGSFLKEYTSIQMILSYLVHLNEDPTLALNDKILLFIS